MDSATTRSVRLIDTELVLLDGQCSDDVQKEVDAAKGRLAMTAALDLPPRAAGFVADVVTEARASGKLLFQHTQLRSCPVCGESRGYAKLKRSSQRHGRRGDPDYRRPLHLSGYELAYRFVIMKGYPHLGCCGSCWKILEGAVFDALEGMPVALPKHWPGPANGHVYHRTAKCTKCDWTGHEGQMRTAPVLFGPGTYQAGCPNCDASNKALGVREVEVDHHAWVVVDGTGTIAARGTS